ncbi:MAG TPA: hypothetical protein VJM34_11315 [Novosphingobium sp.]|nr:hypothetical protein [Novosphingobium sp.]
MNTLKPYGSFEHAHNVAKVGKGKTPGSLAERMPSAEVAAKVGVINISAESADRPTVVRLNARD